MCVYGGRVERVIQSTLLCSARYTTAAVLGICSMSCFCLCLCLYPYASFVCLAQAVDSLTSSPSFLPFTVRATVDSLPLVIVVITRHRHHHHHRGVGRQRHIALPALTFTGAHGRTRLIFFSPFSFHSTGFAFYPLRACTEATTRD